MASVPVVVMKHKDGPAMEIVIGRRKRRLCRASQQSCEGRCALDEVDALAKIFKTAGCRTSQTKVAEQG
jgi:hypothetical protein